ncbi:hypothetical protein PVAG01_06410 [Phlyctema vagabunda]|uniref:Uncharacterized protein n=1 Tax=Phlyctema vagabunda TaxID=108571 RepID=A0ABR4PG03_9HELO
MDCQVDPTHVKIKSRGASEAVVEVVLNADLANTITQTLIRGAQRCSEDGPLLSTRVISNGSQARPRMSSVNCTLFKASRAAWLHYTSLSAAQDGWEALKKHETIYGRKVQFLIEIPDTKVNDRGLGTLGFSVRVDNLGGDITEGTFSSLSP